MPRDLTVRVRADVGAYQKAMSSAASSTDEFAQAGLRLQKVGLQVSNLGDKLTKNVTLPLALAGGAAIKMATDFDNSFTRMQTLAGVSADAVDGLKDSVLDLSGETGRAPQELAEALYFLQSSGLDSAEAMEALEASAKASAIGLGSTEVVADAVSSAMLGYSESGLKAAEATDILIATARAGKAEPAELAGQMGRLIPIAAELGISFDQVGGAIAALSTKGNNAEMATTQLVNVMSKLLKPSEQAAKLLEEVGLSADGIRQMLAEKGLLGTLEELRSRLGDAGFTKFLEDTQAIQGGLALLGGDLNKTKDIFDQVKESAGATDNAFSTWAESMGAQNAQAFAQFQVALIKVGEVLAPIASDVLDFVAKLAEAFSNLPDGAQQAVIAIATLTAVSFPLMSIIGRLITGFGTATRLINEMILPTGSVAGAFNNSAASVSRFSSALATLGKAGVVVGVLIGLREVLGTISDDAKRADLSALENQLLDLADTGEASGATLKRVFGDIGTSAQDAAQTRADIDQLDEALAQLAGRDADAAAEAFSKIREELEAMGVPADLITDRFDNYAAALDEADTANRTTGEAVNEATGAIEEQMGTTEEATSAVKDYADALAAQFDPLFAMRDALVGTEEAQRGVAEAQTALNEALATGDADKIAEAQRNYDQALRGASDSLLDVQQAQLKLNDAIANGDVSLEDAQRQLYDWAVAQGYSGEQALILAGQLGDATAAAQLLGAQNPQPTATLNDQATGSIVALDHKLDELDGKTATVNIVTRETTILAGSRNVPLGRQHGGPVLAGEAYIVGEHRPEVFVPNENGMIWPSLPTTVPGGAFGGGGGVIEVHSHVYLDGREVAESVRRIVQTDHGGNVQNALGYTR